MMTLAQTEIGIVAVIGGLGIAAIAIVFGTIKSMVNRWQRERSRREIAAYVAEGTIAPEEAERLLKADSPGGRCD